MNIEVYSLFHDESDCSYFKNRGSKKPEIDKAKFNETIDIGLTLAKLNSKDVSVKLLVTNNTTCSFCYILFKPDGKFDISEVHSVDPLSDTGKYYDIEIIVFDYKFGDSSINMLKHFGFKRIEYEQVYSWYRRES